MAPSRPPDSVTTAAWLASIPVHPPRNELGPLQLAWLGDAVWELHQRLLRCREPGRSRELHQDVVAAVKAEAQARALERLHPLLSDEERDLVRRGRNRAGRGPRRGEAGLYGLATGFETMVGWLFLQDPQRLAWLLDQLIETEIGPIDP